MEPENQNFDDLNTKGVNPPAYEARGQNPHHVGYDQPSDPRGYNLPQHSLPMQKTNSTVVNVQQAPTVVFGQTRGSDLTIPSMFICFFCCWCTGIPAILLAIRAQRLYDEGNIAEANKSQRWTRYLMIASVIIPVIIYVVLIILYVAVFSVNAAEATTSVDSWSESLADLTTRAPTWG